MSGDHPRRQQRGLAAPDILGLFATLTKHDVAFLVIGGVAVAHHGYIRSTKDLDIIPEPTEANLGRLWDALLEMEAHPLELGDFRPDELPAPLSLEGLLQLGNWALSTTFGRLDILQYLNGKLETREHYDALEDEADEMPLPSGNVLFTSYEDLIDFKNIAGRDQDLTDIRALREARGETDSFDGSPAD
ncbi:MAG: hypothetical protein LH654_09410 [Thermoleophilia bacterium]|nr:hypothetical protein [Thermoleophilia bacterium]